MDNVSTDINNDVKTEKQQQKVQRTAATKETKKEEPKKDTAYIYLGPNTEGGILFHGNIYKQFPTHIKSLVEKIPEIEKLFIEIQNISEFKRELEIQGTYAYSLYKTVEQKLKEGENNVSL